MKLLFFSDRCHVGASITEGPEDTFIHFGYSVSFAAFRDIVALDICGELRADVLWWWTEDTTNSHQ